MSEVVQRLVGIKPDIRNGENEPDQTERDQMEWGFTSAAVEYKILAVRYMADSVIREVEGQLGLLQAGTRTI